jgi:hypothetical protein
MHTHTHTHTHIHVYLYKYIEAVVFDGCDHAGWRRGLASILPGQALLRLYSGSIQALLSLF